MSDNSKQVAIGNNISQIGTYKTIHIPKEHPIRFSEKDLKNIIEAFFEDLDRITQEITEHMQAERVEEDNPFYHPGIEEKNKINNLTQGYFDTLIKDDMCYFSRIDKFLKSPQNKKILDKYLKIAKELKRAIRCYRTEHYEFDRFFNDIFLYVVATRVSFDEDFVYTFLHYMYVNCDIGEKYDKTE